MLPTERMQMLQLDNLHNLQMLQDTGGSKEHGTAPNKVLTLSEPTMHEVCH